MSESKNMGLGTLVDGNTIFARKFRWTLTANHWNDSKSSLELLTQKVRIDFLNKILKFEVIIAYHDNQDIALYDWLEKIAAKAFKEKIFLTTYDGCGQALEQYELDIKDVKEQTMDLDYSASDVIHMKVSLSFHQYKRRFCIGSDDPQDGIVSPHYHWTFSFQDSEGKEIEKEVKISKRPTLNIEETVINHLNASFAVPDKVYLPGKTRWEELIIKPVDRMERWHLLVAKGTHKITMYNHDDPIETWTFLTTDLAQDEQALRLRFTNLLYAVPQKSTKQ